MIFSDMQGNDDKNGCDIAVISAKIEMYCSRAEQCVFSVRKKLQQWHVPAQDVERIVECLKAEGFIDESRFAAAFAHDRLKFGKCGRNKIRYELYQKHIAEKDVAEALKSLDELLYADTLHSVAVAKQRTLKALATDEQRRKLTAYLLSRGFETELIYKEINKVIKNKE
jgi:regulatory protein